MKPIRVILVDDHRLLRSGLRALLHSIPGVEVVGDAPDGNQALAMLADQRPDILLTDISMPGMNGLELVSHVARDYPDTRTIILSMHESKEYAVQALRAGASGYLIKDAQTEELELAIRSVARGESYLSPAVSRHILDDYARLSGGQEAPADPLTPRQREVLGLIAQGLTTKAIAKRLDISAKTADTHRVQLMERLGIHDIAGLVRYAIRIGLIKADA